MSDYISECENNNIAYEYYSDGYAYYYERLNIIPSKTILKFKAYPKSVLVINETNVVIVEFDN